MKRKTAVHEKMLANVAGCEIEDAVRIIATLKQSKYAAEKINGYVVTMRWSQAWGRLVLHVGVRNEH